MRIIKRATLEGFWSHKEYGDSKASLEAWYREASRAKWNDYRLIVEIQYSAQIVWIKFLGTHKQYDDIETSTVDIY